jgi:hypothetical protein
MADGGSVDLDTAPAPHDQNWANAFKKGAGFASGGSVPAPSPSPSPTDFQKKISDAFKANGGIIEAKDKAKKRAENSMSGEKGVHQNAQFQADKGTSDAGASVRYSKDLDLSSSAKKTFGNAAIKEHKAKLEELKSMSSPNLKGLAEGGSVKGVQKSSMGIDHPKDKKEKSWAGESIAGQSLRNSDINDYGMQGAKDEHNRTLGELKSMKAPNLKGLADGGEVSDQDDDLVMKIMHKRYSKGGEVANDVEQDSADHDPDQFDDEVLDDDLSLHDTEANSGDDLGDAEQDDDRNDIVAKIMKSQSKKDKLPKVR